MKKMMIAISILLFIVAFIPSSHAANLSKNMKFKKQVVIDTQGFKMEAFSLLVPEGWMFEGSINWDFNQSIPSNTAAVKISSADGLSVMEMLPSKELNFSWSTDPNERQFMATRGTNVFPPMKPVAFIRDVFIVNFRPEITDFRFIKSTPLPDKAQKSARINEESWKKRRHIPCAQTLKWSAEAADIEMEYFKGNTKMIEHFNITITCNTNYRNDMYMGQVASIAWGVDGYCYRAPVGEMKKKEKLFKTINKSFQWNPKWTSAREEYSINMFAKRCRQQQAKFRSMRRVRKIQSETADMQWNAMQKRSEAQDRMAEQYDKSLRGVDTYTDPSDGSKVELPSGYENTWTNGTDYIQSDDSNYDPNVDSSQNWERMEQED